MLQKIFKVSRRKSISLAVKLNIIVELEGNLNFTKIAKKFELAVTTVRTIWKSKEQIKSAVKHGSLVNKKLHSQIMDKMEDAVALFVNKMAKRNAAIDGITIEQKANSIYAKLKSEMPSSSKGHPKFVASNGWLGSFKRRYQLKNIRVKGEIASADTSAAKLYPLD